MLAAGGAAMAFGGLGLLFARMIKAGVSRPRERLVDAEAVQFAGRTTGLSGALKKIAGLFGGSRLSRRADAEDLGHLLFGDGVRLHGPCLLYTSLDSADERRAFGESLPAGLRLLPEYRTTQPSH